MFTSYYSMNKQPFLKEISVDNLFKYSSYNEGLARLEYLKNTRGIGTIVGDSGSGKTTLVRKFASSLNPSLYKVIYIPLSTVTVNDFYRGLAYNLGEIPKFRKVELFTQIQQAILNLYKNQKITPVIILDEIHMASNSFLNDIALIFNFNMDSENPFILILVGLSHFLEKIKLHHMQPLNQRIIIRHKVNHLTKDEVKDYIDHQLNYAGVNYQIFTPDSIEAISLRTNGQIRVINNLASHCLIFGQANKLQYINAEAIYEVSQALGL